MDVDEVADLFGDFESDDQAATPAAPAAKAAGGGAAREEDLFGDFDSEQEAAQPPKRPAPQGVASGSSGPKPKKAKRLDPSKYFEREAEEAGAGSGDEDDDGDLEDLIDDSGVHEGRKGKTTMASRQQMELDEVRRDMDKRGDDTGSRRVFGQSFLDRLESRYQQQDVDAEVAGAQDLPGAAPTSPGGMSLASFMGEQKEERGPAKISNNLNTFIVPAPEDPKLWCCKTFAPEQQLCLALMLKASTWMAKGKEITIFSAFYSPHLRGYIYIEAFKEADIRAFILGIRGISPWSMQVVPQAQMPQVFQSAVNDAATKLTLKAGDFVRAKRRPYTGDLAQVEEIYDEEVLIKMKPRIQYTVERGGFAKDKDSRMARKRAQQRWFHKADLEASGVMVNVEKKDTNKGSLSFFLIDDLIYRDGFHYSRVKFGHIIKGDEVRPQQHELQDWQLAPPVTINNRPEEDLGRDEDEDARRMPPPMMIPKKAVRTPVDLQDGDIVIVNSGELLNLVATVVKAIYGWSSVTVRPHAVKNTGNLELAIITLSKYFEVGDYVKVVGGEHEGDVGYVMGFRWGNGAKWNSNGCARVLSGDIGMNNEFEVRVEHIQLSVQKADPLDQVGEFKVGAMVHIDSAGSQNRGMIIRIEAGDRAIILMSDGKKASFSFQAMKPAPTPRGMLNMWTLDRRGEKITPKCVVKAPRSNAKAAPIKAEILFIHNDIVFMKAEEALTGERAYLCCSGKKVEYIWNKNDAKKLEFRPGIVSEQMLKDSAPVDKAVDAKAVKMQSEINWLAPHFKKMLGVDAMQISQTGAAVRITSGGYKGLRGEVRDFLGQQVRISLLCKPKLITVALSSVAPDDYDAPTKYEHPIQEDSGQFMVPMDAWGDDEPAEKEAITAITEFDDKASSTSLNEKKCWDPKFLGDKTLDDMTSERKAFTSPVTNLSSEQVGLPTPTLPTKKKRASRIPKANVGLLSPTIDRQSTEHHSAHGRNITESPSSVFGHVKPDADNEVQEPWLIVGLGVKFTQDGQDTKGWIVKVYAESAVVVPETAELGDDKLVYTLRGSETLPWHCDARGDEGVVFDGPRRGTKGKILGIDGSVAFLRPEAEHKNRNAIKFAAVAGNNMIPVERKDLAMYNRAWEKSMKEKQRQPAFGAVLDMAKPREPLRLPDPALGSEHVSETPVGEGITSPFPVNLDLGDDFAGLNDKVSSPTRRQKALLGEDGSPDQIAATESPVADAFRVGYESPTGPRGKGFEERTEDVDRTEDLEDAELGFLSPGMSVLGSPTLSMLASPQAPVLPVGAAVAVAAPSSPQAANSAEPQDSSQPPPVVQAGGLSSPPPPTLSSPPPPVVQSGGLASPPPPLLSGGATPAEMQAASDGAASVGSGFGGVTPLLPRDGAASVSSIGTGAASVGGNSMGGVTPMMGGVTPMGGVMPFLPAALAAAGVAVGGVTPLPGGGATPLPGGATPMLVRAGATPALEGDATPGFPNISGEATPQPRQQRHAEPAARSDPAPPASDAPQAAEPPGGPAASSEKQKGDDEGL